MRDEALYESVAATISSLKVRDPDLERLLETSFGHAVFPAVGRAAFALGVTHGRGVVFERGKPIGTATLNAVTLGLQLGGQTFSEVLLFPDADAVDWLKEGELTFDAHASAVLVKSAATWSLGPGGIAAKVYSDGGLLLELSLGAQKIRMEHETTTRPLAPSPARSDDDAEPAEEPAGRRSRLAARSPARRARDALAALEDDPAEQKALHARAQAALTRMLERNASLRDELASAYGCAIFPSVARGDALVGRAYGQGEVFERGRLVGYAAHTALTVGPQAGGGTLAELVLFDDVVALERFEEGRLGLAANASAVLATAGAMTSRALGPGTVVHVAPEGGMLVGAAVGAQRFVYRPLARLSARTLRTELRD